MPLVTSQTASSASHGPKEGSAASFVLVGSKHAPSARERKRSSLTQVVLVVDDVITAGTAVRESYQMISAAGAQMTGVAILLDRQERGLGTVSAIEEAEKQFNLKVISVITLANLLDYLQQTQRLEDWEKILAYRVRYGV